MLALGPGKVGLASGVASPAPLPPGNIADTGAFILSLAGRDIGTEKFEIRSSGGKIEAKAEIQLRVEQDGKIFETKAFPALVMDFRFQPLTYTWRQTGSQASQLEVDFRSSPAKCRYRTVTGEEDDRDFDLPKDVVVLDDNVLHHYQLIVSRLSLKAGGKQSFKAFIPQQALPGDLTVEDVGWESVEIAGHAENLRHWVVTTELARIDLWADERQRLQRIAVPTAQLEAVRKK